MQNKKHKLKQQLMEMLGGKCVICSNIYHFSAMDFDHLEPKNKRFSMAPLIGRAASGEPKYVEELMQEVKKCQLLCSNCHRIKTFHNKESGGFKKKTSKHKKKWMFQ